MSRFEAMAKLCLWASVMACITLSASLALSALPRPLQRVWNALNELFSYAPGMVARGAFDALFAVLLSHLLHDAC